MRVKFKHDVRSSSSFQTFEVDKSQIENLISTATHTEAN